MRASDIAGLDDELKGFAMTLACIERLSSGRYVVSLAMCGLPWGDPFEDALVPLVLTRLREVAGERRAKLAERGIEIDAAFEDWARTGWPYFGLLRERTS